MRLFALLLLKLTIIREGFTLNKKRLISMNVAIGLLGATLFHWYINFNLEKERERIFGEKASEFYDSLDDGDMPYLSSELIDEKIQMENEYNMIFYAHTILIGFIILSEIGLLVMLSDDRKR
jgi:hypothetical protein